MNDYCHVCAQARPCLHTDPAALDRATLIAFKLRLINWRAAAHDAARTARTTFETQECYTFMQWCDTRLAAFDAEVQRRNAAVLVTMQEAA